jgi:hypothetical protein
MEYLFGFFLGSILMVLFYKFVTKHSLLHRAKVKIAYSQSHVFRTIKPFISLLKSPPMPLKTQATEYEDSRSVRVVMTDSQAYWIRDNVFYTADISEDYSINKNSTRRVDTMGMDRVQLEKIMFIVDRLNEGGGNENSGPGDFKL